MGATHDWVTFECACGFRLERVPRDVVADLPRCLGCGSTLRAPRAVQARRAFSVRDLR